MDYSKLLERVDQMERLVDVWSRRYCKLEEQLYGLSKRISVLEGDRVEGTAFDPDVETNETLELLSAEGRILVVSVVVTP